MTSVGLHEVAKSEDEMEAAQSPPYLSNGAAAREEEREKDFCWVFTARRKRDFDSPGEVRGGGQVRGFFAGVLGDKCPLFNLRY